MVEGNGVWGVAMCGGLLRAHRLIRFGGMCRYVGSCGTNCGAHMSIDQVCTLPNEDLQLAYDPWSSVLLNF